MQLTEHHHDVLASTVNIGVERAAITLNMIAGHQLQPIASGVKILEPEELLTTMGYQADTALAAVSMHFNGPFNGCVGLVIPTESAGILVDCITDEISDTHNLDETRAETLTEIGNILLNGIMGSISDRLNIQLEYSLPEYRKSLLASHIKSHCGDADSVLLLRTGFSIDKLQIEGYVILFFKLASLHRLLQMTDGKALHEPN